MGLWEKHFTDPCTGDCGVAVEDLFRWKWKAALVPYLCLYHHGKCLVVSSARPNKSQCPDFLFHCSGISSLSHCPGSLVLFLAMPLYQGSCLGLHLESTAARPSWLLPKECMNERGEHMFPSERGHFFIKLSYIISGLGQTRLFFKITNQLPKLSQTLDGSTSQLIPSFLRLDWQASMVKHLPLAPFWLLLHMCLSSHDPLINWYWRVYNAPGEITCLSWGLNLLGGSPLKCVNGSVNATASWWRSRLMLPSWLCLTIPSSLWFLPLLITS